MKSKIAEVLTQRRSKEEKERERESGRKRDKRGIMMATEKLN
jgi:hypothetical protein